MAIKTFTTGEVLTAADTNTYLANSGLVYITSGALSSVGTKFVGCFSSTYDNYRIIIRNATMSAPADLCWQMLSGSTAISSNYYNAYRGITSTGGSLDQTSNNSAAGRFPLGTNNVGGRMMASSDFYQPFLASATLMTANGYFLLAGEYGCRNGGAAHDVSTSYDGIFILSSGGQTVTGQVEIYGYRKA